ncbi:rhamnulose-1-phosphate aldolase [Paenibacillus dokdonensis]|uniref:Rhamnulose-1-phosphate aldolase n=2 Tax=Paenibacillus dokdonensis TaxID=2567944 RepID=A0ABU6GLC3_9BACL|nr:rhamnulose-1-phosphate aldolase [Paenibacillus dokdonensis]MEC0238957.1 rhamnulose-1-phosphate aldolase [Paenibacillus dokdonensis]
MMEMTRDVPALEIPFIREMAEITYHMWKFGWDERNGGNISRILDEGEVSPHIDLNGTGRVITLSFPVPELAGKIFVVTGSGKYFRNVISDPDMNLGVIRVTDDGEHVDVLWGFNGNTFPTSELASHFMSHIERLKVDPNHRIVMHTHATNVIAMTFVHDLDEKKFTKTLWQMCTECIVVFPEGVGVLPWMVPGSAEIGRKTAEKMKDRRVVIWPHHGIFGSGSTMDETFGLIETVEKAAQVYMLTAGHGIKQTITDQELADLAKAFGVTPAPQVLEV